MRMRILWFTLGAAVVLATVGFTWLNLGDRGRAPHWAVSGGDAQRGRQAMLKYGCSACHVIEGLREATGRVGPKLIEIDEQIYIGGVLTNSPENMIRWIMDPRKFSSRTAMPALGVARQEALDMAAYFFRN